MGGDSTCLSTKAPPFSLFHAIFQREHPGRFPRLDHGCFPVNISTFLNFHGDFSTVSPTSLFRNLRGDVMASTSRLGVDISADPSSSSPETDSDSDGNVGFSEFDSDSGSDDDAFLGFGDPGDTPVFTWDKSYGPSPNPIRDFDDASAGPTTRLTAEATSLDFFNLFIDDAMLLRWCDFTETNAVHKRVSDPTRHKGEWF